MACTVHMGVVGVGTPPYRIPLLLHLGDGAGGTGVRAQDTPSWAAINGSKEQLLGRQNHLTTGPAAAHTRVAGGWRVAEAPGFRTLDDKCVCRDSLVS